MFYLVHQEILQAIADPSRALLLTALGTAGVCWEFIRPGSILPGVAGATLVVMSVSGLSNFSPTIFGVIMLGAALALFSVGAALPSRTASIAGGAVLFAALAAIPGASASAVLFAGAVFTVVGGYLVPLAARARRNKTGIAERNDKRAHSRYAMGRQS